MIDKRTKKDDVDLIAILRNLKLRAKDDGSELKIGEDVFLSFPDGRVVWFTVKCQSDLSGKRREPWIPNNATAFRNKRNAIKCCLEAMESERDKLAVQIDALKKELATA